MSVIGVYELPDWFVQQAEELLFNYRTDVRKNLDRVEQALVNTVDTAKQLLEEVVIDGEMTVPGAATKLSNRLKTLAEGVASPEQITYSSVQELLDELEEYLRKATIAGRRYIPRLPKVHKKIIKELDYQFRTINQGYQKIKKIWEKDKLPKQLDRIEKEVEEIAERSQQLLKLVEQLLNLQKQKEQAKGRVEEQQGDIAQFRRESGLVEIEGIRKEIDSIRMIVTNQLNFLKKPFKKLSQAAGQVVMISSTAGEGADQYATDPWQAFQKDTETLDQLKAGLNALVEAIQGEKIKFKPSLNRKVLDRKEQVCDKNVLGEYRQRLSTLVSRKDELKSAISIDERRELEKSLERAQWEHRDVAAEIRHNQEQIEKISTRLLALQKRLQQSLSRIIRGDVIIEFPDEVQELLVEGVTGDS